MISASSKNVTFIYDFAISGGAISTINTGLFLPQGYQLIGTLISPITDLNCLLGNSIISIGSTLSGAGTLILGITFSAFTIASWAFAGISNPTVDPIALTPAEEITLSIGMEALTAGSFKATIFYMEY